MASFQNRMFTAEELKKLYSSTQVFYNKIELEDMEYDAEEKVFTYPCPCGDKFQIELEEVLIGEIKAVCPSCSLIIEVSYDMKEVEKYI